MFIMSVYPQNLQGESLLNLESTDGLKSVEVPTIVHTHVCVCFPGEKGQRLHQILMGS